MLELVTCPPSGPYQLREVHLYLDLSELGSSGLDIQTTGELLQAFCDFVFSKRVDCPYRKKNPTTCIWKCLPCPDNGL